MVTFSVALHIGTSFVDLSFRITVLFERWKLKLYFILAACFSYPSLSFNFFWCRTYRIVSCSNCFIFSPGALFVASPESFMWSKESSVVQIVEGNALTCSCKADVVICATSRQKGMKTAWKDQGRKRGGVKNGLEDGYWLVTAPMLSWMQCFRGNDVDETSFYPAGKL